VSFPEQVRYASCPFRHRHSKDHRCFILCRATSTTSSSFKTPDILTRIFQIRAFLHIPADADIILERYSDSAAAYVTLEPGNSAVYKQLYRAAKAKSKLKLRVTLKNQEEAVVPKPVTVEDVQEDSTTAPSPSTSSNEKPEADKKASEPPMVSGTAPVRLPSMSVQDSPAMSRTYGSSQLSEAAKIASPADIRRHFHGRVSGLGPQMEGYTRADGTFAAVAFNDYRMPPAECPRFAICCNSCEETAPDVHYHCSTCDDGDFDLCQSCVDKGITCYGSDHWLIKRTKVDGQIVTSTTETIAPKPKPEAEVQREAEVQAEATVRTEDFLPNLSSFDAAAALANLQENLAKLELNTARLGRPSMRTCNSCIQGKLFLKLAVYRIRILILYRTSRGRVPPL
jgi:next-to-BRCA1 protein 1